MRSPEERIYEIRSAIGKRIKSIRKERGFSLEELAKRTGFAKSYLSQIENLRREPSISTLAKIAYKLGVDLFFLLGGEAQQSDEPILSIVKSSERKMIRRPFGSSGYLYESISFKKLDKLMDAYVISTGFEFPLEPFVHEGEELVYVLEGKQQLEVDGRKYIVEEGDCYYLDSKRSHFAKSIGEKQAKVLAVFASKGGTPKKKES